MARVFKTLTLIPRGNVEVNKDYGVRKISFENGINQYQRLFVTPRITYGFNVEGNKQMKYYLENFIDEMHGSMTPFKWVYDGKEHYVRFSESTIKFTEIRGYEGEGTVGYRATIGLEECKESELT